MLFLEFDGLKSSQMDKRMRWKKNEEENFSFFSFFLWGSQLFWDGNLGNPPNPKSSLKSSPLEALKWKTCSSNPSHF